MREEEGRRKRVKENERKRIKAKKVRGGEDRGVRREEGKAGKDRRGLERTAGEGKGGEGRGDPIYPEEKWKHSYDFQHKDELGCHRPWPQPVNGTLELHRSYRIGSLRKRWRTGEQSS
jgi:hypothetical protein